MLMILDLNIEFQTQVFLCLYNDIDAYMSQHRGINKRHVCLEFHTITHKTVKCSSSKIVRFKKKTFAM